MAADPLIFGRKLLVIAEQALQMLIVMSQDSIFFPFEFQRGIFSEPFGRHELADVVIPEIGAGKGRFPETAGPQILIDGLLDPGAILQGRISEPFQAVFYEPAELVFADGPIERAQAGNPFPFPAHRPVVFFQSFFRGAVDGEDIDINPPECPSQFPVDHSRPFPADFDERLHAEIALRQVQHLVLLRLELPHKTVVVRPRHQKVDVVVPGNVTLVADGPDQRPVGEGIAQPPLPAEGVDFVQDGKLDLLDLSGIE